MKSGICYPKTNGSSPSPPPSPRNPGTEPHLPLFQTTSSKLLNPQSIDHLFSPELSPESAALSYLPRSADGMYAITPLTSHTLCLSTHISTLPMMINQPPTTISSPHPILHPCAFFSTSLLLSSPVPSPIHCNRTKGELFQTSAPSSLFSKSSRRRRM